MASLYNFDIICGESRCISTVVNDSNGDPLNLSTYNIARGGVKVGFGNNSYLINLNPSITLPSGISLNLSGYQTSGVPSSVYPYDVEVAATGLSGDNTVLKILRGYVSFYPEVSNI